MSRLPTGELQEWLNLHDLGQQGGEKLLGTFLLVHQALHITEAVQHRSQLHRFHIPSLIASIVGSGLLVGVDIGPLGNSIHGMVFCLVRDVKEGGKELHKNWEVNEDKK